MATEYKASNLSGLFLYQYKNQVVYYDVFSKNAYVISNSDAKGYLTHLFRLPAAVMAAWLVYMVSKNIAVSAIVGLIVFGVWEYIFRKKYLGKLPQIDNFIKPIKNNFINRIALESSFLRMFILVIVFALMCITCFWGVKYGDISGFYFVTTGLICAISGVAAVFFLVAIVIKFLNRD